MKVDIHCHTEFSPDAHYTMEQHCLSAIEKGLDVICFTDHVDCEEPFSNCDVFQYVKRYETFVRCKEQFAPQLKVLIGLEFGEPNQHRDVFERVTGQFDYDFILGSVHMPCDLAMTGTYTAEKMNAEHYRRSLELASSGLVDSLAHLDFPKKFNPKFVINRKYTKMILAELISHDTCLEVNYSTVRRGQVECCPDMQTLREYVALGGRYITMGSDSHLPQDIAVPLDQIVSRLPEELIPCYFEGRKRVPYSFDGKK